MTSNLGFIPHPAQGEADKFTTFEKPKQMAQQHPALYNQLQYYYKLDPREWI
ncbi:MAG: hypothetical protein QNJ72_09075 [Pleurocapsa sp. MO_226.B13]|nr:hypothetical protein [Pleurocapsa sp. MO_226.B13]